MVDFSKAHYLVEGYIDPTMLNINLSDMGLKETDWTVKSSQLDHNEEEGFYRLEVILHSQKRVKLVNNFSNEYIYEIGDETEKKYILNTKKMPTVDNVEQFSRKIVNSAILDYNKYICNGG